MSSTNVENVIMAGEMCQLRKIPRTQSPLHAQIQGGTADAWPGLFLSYFFSTKSLPKHYYPPQSSSTKVLRHLALRELN